MTVRQPHRLSHTFFCLLVLIAALFTFANPASADSLDTWRLRNPLIAKNLNGISYGNGIFVAVGSEGSVLTSFDGAYWVRRNSGTTNNLSSVLYANGLFVACGDNVILTSLDGTSWTARAVAGSLKQMAYGNGIHVAVGDSGIIITSFDGTNWTSQTSGTSDPLSGVAYGNGVFVAVGGFDLGRSSSDTILSSSDGVNWTVREQGSYGFLNSVAFGKGRFVTVDRYGRTLTSLDGVQWNISHYDIQDSDLTFIGGNFVGFGTGSISTSPDGSQWITRETIPNAFMQAITYGNGKFVSVGAYGGIFVSPDLLKWTSLSSPPFHYLNGLFYGNGLFVATGDNGTILTSPDGVIWTSRSGDDRLFSGTHGNGIFVIVGWGGTILSSPDGVTWTPRRSGTLLPLYGVAYGNNIFAAVGIDNAASSMDGITWRASALGNETDSLNAIAFGNGLFVAVGNGSLFPGPGGGYGAIETSSDGITWTPRTSGTDKTLNAIAYGNGLFVAVGDNCTILTSADGITWTDEGHPCDPDLYDNLKGIAYGNGLFVVTGPYKDIFTSSDGIHWTARRLAEPVNLNSIAYGNGTFVALEEFGTGIWQSGSLIPDAPPSEPELISPSDNVNVSGETLVFKWKKSSDPDGDAVYYRLYVCEDAGCSNCNPLNTIAGNEGKKISYASTIDPFAWLFAISFFYPLSRRRKKTQILYLTLLLCCFIVFASCGGGGGGRGPGGGTIPKDEISYTISGVKPGTYYWKVVAFDAKGAETESETRSFSVPIIP